ncbi:hypothetical protein AAF712_010146 [Marasmius tenuissimus]|uniref:Uncharacterized protein n=1 Tax=Marasmius tenuissimus TaxID=585030 RepID=A0ABR2ZMX7_9AGAR
MSRSPSPTSNSSDAVLVCPPNQSRQHTSFPVASQGNNIPSPVCDQPDNDKAPLEKVLDAASSIVVAGNGKSAIPERSGSVKKGGWGKGGSTWGSWGVGKWAPKDYEFSEERPKVTSLAIKQDGWGTDESHFVWRSNTTGHRHVTHFTRSDLSTTLVPEGPEKPSALDDVATPEWARAQLIKSLREAQESGIPGPVFTLSQVAHRLADVRAQLSQLESKLSDHTNKITDMGVKQVQLRDEAAELDDKIYGMRGRTSELETAVREMLEVEKDLKDLQAIALTYSQ